MIEMILKHPCPAGCRIRLPRAIGLAAATMAFAAGLHGVRTESVSQESFGDFFEGEPRNIVIDREGFLTLGPEASLIGELEEPIIWSAAAGRDGDLIVGTGNAGKVFRLTRAGEWEELFSTGEVLIRAVAVGADGSVYAGASPEGKVYRLAPGAEEPEVFFDPEDPYIWALEFSEAGDLFVATGDNGRVYRIPAGGDGEAAEVYFESGEAHVSALAWESSGVLLAGSSPQGYLYRVTAAEEAFVLFNSPDEEIRQIVVADEWIHVATFSGGPLPNAGANPGGYLSAAMAAISSSTNNNGESGGNATPRRPAAAGTNNVQRVSTVYRVDAEGFYETHWALPGVPVHSLLATADGRLLIGGGSQGRLFSVQSPQSWNLRERLPEGSEISALLPDPAGNDSIIALTSNPARAYRLGKAPAPEGEFLASAHDAGQIARWGRLHVDADRADGLTVEARSGNTEEPDAHWSGWHPVGGDGVSETPPGRYFQYKLVLQNPGDGGPRVNRARFFYRSANAAPEVTAIRVVTSGVGLERFQMPPQQPNIDLDQLFRPSGGQAGPPEGRSQVRAYERPGTITVAWQARDPNEDDLLFSVSLRREGSGEWLLLGDGVDNTFLSFNTAGMEEGDYRVKITASDHLSNLPGEARDASRVSDLFRIDNRPPEITVAGVEVEGRSAVIRWRAEDGHSLVTGAEYVLNGGDPRRLYPENGFFDATSASFTLRLDLLESGKQTVLLHAMDEARNVGSHALTFQVP